VKLRDYEIDLKRYRIGVINDFKDAYAFADYKDWGPLQTFDASFSTGRLPLFQVATHSIGVFLNFKLVGEFKDKASARGLVCSLINAAPASAQKDFEAHRQILLDAVGAS
jgi:hypothetical protein